MREIFQVQSAMYDTIFCWFALRVNIVIDGFIDIDRDSSTYQ